MLTSSGSWRRAAASCACPGREVPDQIDALQERIRGLERETERLRGQLAARARGDLLERAVDVNGARVLAARVDVDGKDALRQMGDRLRDHCSPA